jgi:hypothetical protein
MADSPAGTLGPVNWGSNVVNGQLVTQAPSSAFYPLFMGAQYVNPKWSSQQPYGVPPVIPSPAMSNRPPMNTVAPTQAGAMNSNSSPWHPTRGTIVFGLGALILGIFMLHYIHYGHGKK